MGQKYSAEYKADVLETVGLIGVRAASDQLGLSTKPCITGVGKSG